MLSRLLIILTLYLAFAPNAHAQAVTDDLIPAGNWWRNCASLDMDFYNDRYYVNSNTTCDGTVGTQYSGIANFITGIGATFTRGGTSNVTTTGIPFYLASNESFVSRASAANYYNSSGTVTSAATNVARTDYNPSTLTSLGTLVEPAATNLLTYSQDFTNAAWTKSGVFVNAAAATAPDGTNTGQSLNYSSGTSLQVQQVPTISSGATLTFSVYAKAGTKSSVTLIYYTSGTQFTAQECNLSTGALGAATTVGTTYSAAVGSIQNVGNGWYRCLLTTTTTGITSTNVWIRGDTEASSGDYIYIWGAQLESGSYPTSYIATTTATVTRSADLYSALAGGSNTTSTSAPFYLASNQYYYSRASTGTYFDSGGTMQTAPFYAGRTNYTYNGSSWVNAGILIEPAATNGIRNNTMVGAVAGTPGTLPANWGITIQYGLTSQVIGTGTSNGIPYIDLRLYGTPTGSGFTNLILESITTNAASYPQQWAHSAYIALVGGSFTNLSAMLHVAEYNSSQSYLTELPGSVSISTATSTLTRYAQTGPTNNAGTAYVVPYIQFNYTSGLPVDVTLRIGLPQLEQGSAATSAIPTSGSTATRAADQYTNPYGATYYNASGLIASAAPNVPRLDHDPATLAPKGVLIEEGRTNLLVQSNNFTTTWVGWNPSITTPNAGTAPDGTNTAWNTNNTNINSGGIVQTIAVSSPTVGTQYTASVWAKNAASNPAGGVCVSVAAYGGANTAANLANICDPTTNAWQRFSATGAMDYSDRTSIKVVISNANAAGTNFASIANTNVLIWGAQLEQGAFVTSYIPTAAATVTRPIDQFSIPTGTWFNASAGTFFVTSFGNLNTTQTYYSRIIGGTKPFIAFGNSLSNLNTWTGAGVSSYTPTFSPAASTTVQVRGALAWDAASSTRSFLADGTAPATSSYTGDFTASVIMVGSDTNAYALNTSVVRITFLPVRVPDAALTQGTH